MRLEIPGIQIYFYYCNPKIDPMERIVIFSGAGMSAESGISTFRDSGGLWEQYDIYEVATPEAWRRNQKLVQDFYNQRRKQIMNVEPNEAHRFIAELGKRADVQVITQNIDDLHERAGSQKVLHLHGNIRYARSSGANKEKLYPVQGWELNETHLCDDGYQLRPHVVWFGEEVPELAHAAELIAGADTLIVIGTSLNVYPAAGLIYSLPENGKIFLIDPNADEITAQRKITRIPMKAGEGLRFWAENFR